MTLIILGTLFFFSKITAPDAPIVIFLSKNASIAFGQQGLWVFFGLCILIGSFIIWKGHLIKTFIKQFFLLMFFASGILNFQALLPSGEHIINRPIAHQHGGFFSWPLYRLLQKVFGQATLAIQILIVIGAILSLIRVFYKLNVKLPPLPKLSIEKYDNPHPENKKKES